MSQTSKLAAKVKAVNQLNAAVNAPESFGQSVETIFYVGDINSDNELTKLYEHIPLRADYTAEEITKLRAYAEAARNSANRAESALVPFGRFDQ